MSAIRSDRSWICMHLVRPITLAAITAACFFIGRSSRACSRSGHSERPDLELRVCAWSGAIDVSCDRTSREQPNSGWREHSSSHEMIEDYERPAETSRLQARPRDFEEMGGPGQRALDRNDVESRASHQPRERRAIEFKNMVRRTRVVLIEFQQLEEVRSD